MESLADVIQLDLLPLVQAQCRETARLAAALEGLVRGVEALTAELTEGELRETRRLLDVLLRQLGCPYERAIALTHGHEAAQLEALEVFETLRATAVAAKLRKAMRDQGLSVPRGKGRTTRNHAAGLTARQAEVLALLAEGFSNTEIADHLFISPRTVENHVAAVLSKLDSSTRDDAVSVARAEGLLPTAGG